MDLGNLDWVLIAILLVSVVFSVVKGFTRELISLGALIWGFLLACWFYPVLGARLLPYARNGEVASLVAFLLILFGVMVLGALVASLAKKLVEKSGLRWFDRLLGASFGLVRGLLVCVILILVLAVFPVGPRPLENSRLAPYMMEGARVVVTVAPAEMRSRFRSGLDRMRQAWGTRNN